VRWRKANPSVPLEPHMNWDQPRIPKRKLEENSVGTIPTNSSTAPPPKEALRRKPTPARTGPDASQARRPCLAAAATDLGVFKRDGTPFRCSDKCSFSRDWRTIEPWVLSRYLTRRLFLRSASFGMKAKPCPAYWNSRAPLLSRGEAQRVLRHRCAYLRSLWKWTPPVDKSRGRGRRLWATNRHSTVRAWLLQSLLFPTQSASGAGGSTPRGGDGRETRTSCPRDLPLRARSNRTLISQGGLQTTRHK
jgi:hypothetical protein